MIEFRFTILLRLSLEPLSPALKYAWLSKESGFALLSVRKLVTIPPAAARNQRSWSYQIVFFPLHTFGDLLRCTLCTNFEKSFSKNFQSHKKFKVFSISSWQKQTYAVYIVHLFAQIRL